MIIDTIDNLPNYFSINKRFKQAFSFLKKKNIKKYAPGKYDICGKDIYAVISETKGQGRRVAALEVHKKYIDIQICSSGEDLIGYKPLSECKKDKGAYNSKSDCKLFNDKIDMWVRLPVNYFAIFSPVDAHAPLAGRGLIKKIVIKVRTK